MTTTTEDDKPTPCKYGKHPEKPIKLIRFSADWCGHCIAMAKSRVLEKLAEKHPDVEVIVIDVDEDEATADDYEVQSMPSIFFEDLEGYILEEHEGGINDAQLEKLYLKAKAKVKSS